MLPTSASSLDRFLPQKHKLKHVKEPHSTLAVAGGLYGLNSSAQAWVENGMIEACQRRINGKPVNPYFLNLFDSVDFPVLGVKD